MALLLLRWEGLLPLKLTLELSLGPGFVLLGLTATSSAAAETDRGTAEVPAGLEAAPGGAAELRRAVQRSCAGATTRDGVLQRLRRCAAAWRHSRGSVPILQLAAGLATGQAAAEVATAAPAPAPAPASGLQRRVLQSPVPDPRVRLFLERVGCQTARLTWEVLSGDDVGDGNWEIELLTLQRAAHPAWGPRRPRHQGEAGVGLRSLGCTLIPGGFSVRQFVFRRLRPLTWHHARIRAVGPRRCWTSGWSEELSFKTTSIEDAKAAGRPFDAQQVLVPSELRVLAAVVARGVRSDASTPTDEGEEEEVEELADEADEVEEYLSQLGVGADSRSSVLQPFSETEASIWSSRALPQVQHVQQGPQSTHNSNDDTGSNKNTSKALEGALGGSLDADTALAELLRARTYQDGCSSFVNSGLKYSRPQSTRDARLRRAKLTLAAKLLYEPTLAEGNPWFMGPFYYGDGSGAAKAQLGA